jgi:formylglycine-generating enzyme required for sulfatase activity
MVLIAGGRFTMGDKEEPDAAPHEITVSSFYMDKYS